MAKTSIEITKFSCFLNIFWKNSIKLPPTELAEPICVFLYGGEILQLGDIFFQEMKKKKKKLKNISDFHRFVLHFSK